MYCHMFHFLDDIVGFDCCILFREWPSYCLVMEPTGEQNLARPFSNSHIQQPTMPLCLSQTSGFSISIMDTAIIIISTILSIAFHEFGHAVAAARYLCLIFSCLFFVCCVFFSFTWYSKYTPFVLKLLSLGQQF
jgi:hypothetical protein